MKIRRLVRRIACTSLALCLLPASSCASTRSPVDAERSLRFACDGGQWFSVHDRGTTALISTRSGDYQLERRRSSIGRKYVSEAAAFIQDEDRAVLVFTEGPSFENCRLSGQVPAAAIPRN